MNKLRALCEKLKSLSWDDSGLCTDPDVDECADELRAILPDVERLVEALRESRIVVSNFATENPLWSHGGVIQDPSGAHALLHRIDSALALFDQPVAPKETK